MTEANGAIDIKLYTIENVLVYLIPAPPNGTEEHNISYWQVDNPIWMGNLEMHEIEYYMEDSSEKLKDGTNFDPIDYNPFNSLSNSNVSVAEDYFKLELRLINESDNSVFARIPQLSSLSRNVHNIIATVSPKYYAVYTEISDPNFNLNVIIDGNSLPQNKGIKRIGLGLKFESSYDASNFVMYLGHFKKDFEVFRESFLDSASSTNEAEDKVMQNMNGNNMHSNQIYIEKLSQSSSSSSSSSESDNENNKNLIDQQHKNNNSSRPIGRTMESMRDQFCKIDLGDSLDKLNSENDSSDEDFGDFQQT